MSALSPCYSLYSPATVVVAEFCFISLQFINSFFVRICLLEKPFNSSSHYYAYAFFIGWRHSPCFSLLLLFHAIRCAFSLPIDQFSLQLRYEFICQFR